jgi:ABC-2 type transport system ATP-binding protein
MDNVIAVESLTHRFGPLTALDHLTFSLAEGEVLGLLGPNGAGKTTTVRLVNGLYHPVDGKLRVLGLDPTTDGDQVRRQTGVLTESPALYERLTARHNLTFFADLSEIPPNEAGPRIDELLAFFELTDRAGDQVGGFSKGMKQRLALARCLLHRPALLFFDEPTAGLDPEAAAQVRDLIADLARQEIESAGGARGVLLCTHNLIEAERLCDRLAILNQGHLLALGTLDELRSQVSPGLWVAVHLLEPMENGFDSLRDLPGLQELVMESGDAMRARVRDERVIPELVSQLIASGARILSVQPHKASLEDIYFKLQKEVGA